jgi:hypothetical protein
MFCEHCGQELAEGTRYCICCGAEQSLSPAQQAPFAPNHPAQPARPPRAAKPGRPKGKYALFGAGGFAAGAILLAAILLIAGVFSSAGVGTIEGPGFATPEEAAKAYLTGLRDQDIDAMISAFAVETYVEHYDFDAMVERLQAYMINYELPYPNTSDYTRQLNVESRRSRIVSQISIQYLYFNAPDALNNGAPVTLSDPDTLSDFVKDFKRDTEDSIFDDLTITAALSSEGLPDDPEDALEALLERLPKDVREDLLDEISEDDLEYMLDIYLSKQNQKNIEKQAETFGAEFEDVANVAVIFKADGDTWIFCPQAVRYGGRWYLQSLQGNVAIIAGMSTYMGGIAPIG